ncbi:glycosyltransferase family 8 protein [Xylaria intraflava]|nr:glycosyltransferase family 8 protein [Xylaria intraflava]
MNRTDLHSAFTKINLWKQTQFRKIVYIDADVVAYRAPDELFNIPHPFSAAPDIGWPDLFNTGVMVLSPNMDDYHTMMAMAERGISFDGADQGLINAHFGSNYNRISFAYNVTPSAHYQYIPAYRHFESSISMVHFIGPDKPWFQGRQPDTGDTPYDQMVGRWWEAYDRYYRAPSPALDTSASVQSPGVTGATQPTSELVQYLTKGEFQPKTLDKESPSKYHDDEHRDHYVKDQYDSQKYNQVSHHQGDHHHSLEAHNAVLHSQHDHQLPDTHSHISSLPVATAQSPETTSFSSTDVISSSGSTGIPQAEVSKEEIHVHKTPVFSSGAEKMPVSLELSMSSWDAPRHPPPIESKPEALNFPDIIYEMSKSSDPFVAPQRYPSPPKDMWYEIPKEAPASPSEPLKPIFPWEAHRPKPSRLFIDEQHHVTQDTWESESGAPAGEVESSPETQLLPEPSLGEPSTLEQESDPATPVTPTIHITPSDPWYSFSRTNVWDEVPEIERYVDSMQKRRRSRGLKSPGVIGLPSRGEDVDDIMWRWRGSRVTDFPSAAERPSLPVTPAPIRRQNFWGGGPLDIDGGDSNPLLPSAAGVPSQSDWVCVHGKSWTRSDCLCELANALRVHKDPTAQLQKLAKKQSERF